MQNPPETGEYRVVNQFANVHSANTLASKVAEVCKQMKIEVEISKIKNPRKEADKHYYNPDNQNLKNLGYVPSADFEEEIRKLIKSIKPFKKRILKYSQVLDPTIKW